MPATKRSAPAPEDAIESHAALSASIRALAKRGVVRHYRKGTILIEEGDDGDALYIILSGRLRSFSRGDDGREITYGVYLPGDYLGEMSLDGGPRSASVITLEASQCAFVSRVALQAHIAEHPQFALELIARVIQRARAATASARSLALLDTYARLVQMLASLAHAQPDGTLLVEQRLTHADMSSRIGCSREMVSRLLKDLIRGNYIELTDSGRLRLLKRLPQRW